MEPECFTIELDPAANVMRVSGDPSAQDLVELTARLSEQARSQLTVDLSGLIYVPSRIIGVTLEARRRARSTGGDIDIVADVGSFAHRVLAMSGLLRAPQPRQP